MPQQPSENEMMFSDPAILQRPFWTFLHFRIDRNRFIWSIALILIGILLPFMTQDWPLQIQFRVRTALLMGNQVNYVLSSVALVIMNSLRAMPHYVGVFFLADAIHPDWPPQLRRWGKMLFVTCLIPLIYAIINHFYYSDYDFGTPAVTLVLLLIFIGDINYSYVSTWKKVLLILFFLTAVQFLDIMPALNALPFGRGELSTEVKELARFMDLEPQMNLITGAFFLLFFSFGLVTFLLLRDENRTRMLEKLRQEKMILESQARVKDLENRNLSEMKQIVHDLKTPLTSIQTLVSLVKMTMEGEHRDQETEYLANVEGSIDTLNQMINDILHPVDAVAVGIDEILNDTYAGISPSPFARWIHMENQAPNDFVYVNRLTFVRVLMNLLNNAGDAVRLVAAPRIDLRVCEEMDHLLFIIHDNGTGIHPDDLSRVWELGFSRTESSGLGLSFVKEKVEQMGGTIDVHSEYGRGTTFEIRMPGEEREDASPALKG